MQPIQKALTQQIMTILQAGFQQGLKDVILSPGSRSTPIAILLGKMQDQDLINLYVDVDERSAAFFALGLAKVKKQPVLLVCTSGTAAANYYPAICEAYASNIPLVILTTDRPPELQDIGAAQTLKQVDLYHHQVKQAWNLPAIDLENQKAEIKYSHYLIKKAFQTALQCPEGPVHLNLPLRKPLMPDLNPDFSDFHPSQSLTLSTTITPSALQALQDQLQNKRGLIVAGPQIGTDAEQEALVAFAHKMNWPLIADPLSNLRCYPETITQGKWICQFFQQLTTDYYPEVILRTGATLVAAEISTWLRQIHLPIIYLDSNRAYLDDTLSTTMALPLSPAAILPKLNLQPASPQWLQRWQRLDQQIKHLLELNLQYKSFNEPQIAQTISANLPSQAQLFISNSLPIREIEAFSGHFQTGVQLFGNRGLNGIDGVNSTALAMAAAKSSPAYLYIGDLAFFHDLTGLMMGVKYHLNLTILIQNNNGGGIFSFLPQVQAADQFEKVFGTPQNLQLAALAKFYQTRYINCTNYQELQQLLCQKPQGITLVELNTQRNQLTSIEHQLSQKIKASLRI
ncbi:2-succinyl-5-enolpyruvyl-6-hydroxy-3-cyclohexene-1-carboxylic-acid synthase [Bombilactobacillus bombi]|uniref:2-succinyl-5-enolpyruvyl-6-hydroxy-3- cyclohexene-1-carboxylic-acid synthase n=1 Tax=Bombilactobacillus bombi TaxID=1303590 RepID=UPI0015E5B709|nr:2-succinyl-5-enolpyruvyl-6-hydroxy-3-cyclohexene-1-carboxylic-acid synthase [Bombilactobacillus bombi]MBA1433716.1 2-succinyl-5-enolpyruvyl-6-hydroxy-3-cyclohexene-1-carboxylic-acid synthase [Bombilactobacillus bombi]